MEKVLIVVPNGHVSKYLQCVMYSLKNNPNQVESDILVMNTWPGHPSIKAITENDLSENVMIKDCATRKHSHATALDEALDWVAGKDYTMMFTLETDCMAMKPGWLDWFVNFLKDDARLGIAGFFWHEGDHHYNINPSGTLYRMDMLLKYHKEARENNSDIFYHPRGNRLGTDAGMDPTIKDVVGCFAETRGIKDPTPAQLDVILKGVPQAAWFEPGAWLYARLQGEWGEVRVPCDHIYMQYPGHVAPEGTYYGGKANAQFIHLWGGTRCYDWKKHPVSDNFVRSCAPAWIKREDKIWKETVPEKYRSIISKINEEEDVVGMMMKNLGFFVPEVL